MTPNQLIDLYDRSEDIGDGWKRVSDLIWDMIAESKELQDLFEFDFIKNRIKERELPVKTLMLNIKGRPVPFAFQVPDPTYEKFKHFETIEVFEENNLIKEIEAHGIQVQKELFDSINKWRTKATEELDSLETIESSQIRASNLFT